MMRAYPYSGGEYDQNAIQNDEKCEKAKEQEPEPDKNVNFFIDWKIILLIIDFDQYWFLLIATYIKWQYTHGVMFLYLATGPELVESTLGHPGENVNLKTENISTSSPPASLD